MRVTAETKEATRQSILEAARKLFADPGYETATTRDIARAAGIGVGTLFNYFPAKERIVLALVEEAWSRAAGGLAASLSQPADADPPGSLEEDLFAHVAAILRKTLAKRPEARREGHRIEGDRDLAMPFVRARSVIV